MKRFRHRRAQAKNIYTIARRYLDSPLPVIDEWNDFVNSEIYNESWADMSGATVENLRKLYSEHLADQLPPNFDEEHSDGVVSEIFQELNNYWEYYTGNTTLAADARMYAETLADTLTAKYFYDKDISDAALRDSDIDSGLGDFLTAIEMNSDISFSMDDFQQLSQKLESFTHRTSQEYLGYLEEYLEDLLNDAKDYIYFRAIGLIEEYEDELEEMDYEMTLEEEVLPLSRR